MTERIGGERVEDRVLNRVDIIDELYDAIGEGFISLLDIMDLTDIEVVEKLRALADDLGIERDRLLLVCGIDSRALAVIKGELI